ncbi:hypothetical protein PanWU01x14_307580 [Parasponia andersonii]|uniref:Uncharacterized protein n=1 Tax=Parasponia andersonii TaxID=3476 RepID=A0A2P5ARF0_PARAD|nr:hypothetical protein PanWU01x14_307580 [Parasponia andersonii]
MYTARDGCINRDLVVGAKDVGMPTRASGRSRDLRGSSCHLGWWPLEPSQLTRMAIKENEQFKFRLKEKSLALGSGYF